MTSRSDPAMLGQTQYPREHADFYPTPPEFLDPLLRNLPGLDTMRVWEPACGEGHLWKKLLGATGSDLHDRGCGLPNVDFLKQTEMLNQTQHIITNPPYSHADEFVTHALNLAPGIVAMFMRNEWDCAASRTCLFQRSDFMMKIVVTKRPRWIEGSTGSPRHNYSWFVWDKQYSGSPRIVYDRP